MPMEWRIKQSEPCSVPVQVPSSLSSSSPSATTTPSTEASPAVGRVGSITMPNGDTIIFIITTPRRVELHRATPTSLTVHRRRGEDQKGSPKMTPLSATRIGVVELVHPSEGNSIMTASFVRHDATGLSSTLTLWIGTSNGTLIVADACINGQVLVVTQLCPGKVLSKDYSLCEGHLAIHAICPASSTSTLLWNPWRVSNDNGDGVPVGNDSQSVYTRSLDIVHAKGHCVSLFEEHLDSLLTSVYVTTSGHGQRSGGSPPSLGFQATFLSAVANMEHRRPSLEMHWASLHVKDRQTVFPYASVSCCSHFGRCLKDVIQLWDCPTGLTEQPVEDIRDAVCLLTAAPGTGCSALQHLDVSTTVRRQRTLIAVGGPESSGILAFSLYVAPTPTLSSGKMAMEVASRITGAAIQTLKKFSLWGGSAMAAEKSSQMASSNAHSLGDGRDHPVGSSAAYSLSPSTAYTSLVPSPCGRYAALMSATSDRVCVLDCASGIVSKIIKGCRKAEVQWLLVTEGCERHTSRRSDGHVDGPPHFVIAVYQGLRGVVELFSLRKSTRVGAFRVGPGLRLVGAHGTAFSATNQMIFWNGEASSITSYRILPRRTSDTKHATSGASENSSSILSRDEFLQLLQTEDVADVTTRQLAAIIAARGAMDTSVLSSKAARHRDQVTRQELIELFRAITDERVFTAAEPQSVERAWIALQDAWKVTLGQPPAYESHILPEDQPEPTTDAQWFHVIELHRKAIAIFLAFNRDDDEDGDDVGSSSSRSQSHASKDDMSQHSSSSFLWNYFDRRSHDEQGSTANASTMEKSDAMTLPQRVAAAMRRLGVTNREALLFHAPNGTSLWSYIETDILPWVFSQEAEESLDDGQPEQAAACDLRSFLALFDLVHTNSLTLKRPLHGVIESRCSDASYVDQRSLLEGLATIMFSSRDAVSSQGQKAAPPPFWGFLSSKKLAKRANLFQSLGINGNDATTLLVLLLLSPTSPLSFVKWSRDAAPSSGWRTLEQLLRYCASEVVCQTCACLPIVGDATTRKGTIMQAVGSRIVILALRSSSSSSSLSERDKERIVSLMLRLAAFARVVDSCNRFTPPIALSRRLSLLYSKPHSGSGSTSFALHSPLRWVCCSPGLAFPPPWSAISQIVSQWCTGGGNEPSFLLCEATRCLSALPAWTRECSGVWDASVLDNCAQTLATSPTNANAPFLLKFAVIFDITQCTLEALRAAFASSSALAKDMPLHYVDIQGSFVDGSNGRIAKGYLRLCVSMLRTLVSVLMKDAVSSGVTSLGDVVAHDEQLVQRDQSSSIDITSSTVAPWFPMLDETVCSSLRMTIEFLAAQSECDMDVVSITLLDVLALLDFTTWMTSNPVMNGADNAAVRVDVPWSRMFQVTSFGFFRRDCVYPHISADLHTSLAEQRRFERAMFLHAWIEGLMRIQMDRDRGNDHINSTAALGRWDREVIRHEGRSLGDALQLDSEVVGEVSDLTQLLYVVANNIVLCLSDEFHFCVSSTSYRETFAQLVQPVLRRYMYISIKWYSSLEKNLSEESTPKEIRALHSNGSVRIRSNMSVKFQAWLREKAEIASSSSKTKPAQLAEKKMKLSFSTDFYVGQRRAMETLVDSNFQKVVGDHRIKDLLDAIVRVSEIIQATSPSDGVESASDYFVSTEIAGVARHIRSSILTFLTAIKTK